MTKDKIEWKEEIIIYFTVIIIATVRYVIRLVLDTFNLIKCLIPVYNKRYYGELLEDIEK